MILEDVRSILIRNIGLLVPFWSLTASLLARGLTLLWRVRNTSIKFLFLLLQASGMASRQRRLKRSSRHGRAKAAAVQHKGPKLHLKWGAADFTQQPAGTSSDTSMCDVQWSHLGLHDSAVPVEAKRFSTPPPPPPKTSWKNSKKKYSTHPSMFV